MDSLSRGRGKRLVLSMGKLCGVLHLSKEIFRFLP